jgi:hypothetical protein
VTIIAGFRCQDGIVICADTQETTSMGGIPLSKRNIPKLQFNEHNIYDRSQAGLPELAVASCGAGDGPFIAINLERVANLAGANLSGVDPVDEGVTVDVSLYSKKSVKNIPRNTQGSSRSSVSCDLKESVLRDLPAHHART